MIDALRYETVRIRTIRSTYWLLGLGVVLSAAVALIISLASGDDTHTVGDFQLILTGGGNNMMPFLAIFVAIVGIFSTGHEYRHGTIQPTLLAVPQRSRILLGKILIVAVTGLLAALLSLVVNFVIAIVFWGETPDLGTSPLPESLAGYVVLIVLHAVLGLALAQLFRGVPSAIVVLLVFPLVEQLIGGLSTLDALDWLQPVLKFLPFSAGQRLMAVEDFEFTGGPNFDYLDRWASGGVFAAFTVIILAIAWTLFKKRDA